MSDQDGGILSPEQVADLKAAYPEGKREKQKKEAMSPALRQRAKRARDKAAKEADASETVDLFWNKNRAAISPEELQELLAQHQRVLDQIEWMAQGLEVSPEDPDYVSMQEGVDDLVAFLKEFGVVHLGYIHNRDSDVPSNWREERYWSNTRLLEKLYAEGRPTEIYVKTGLLTALPDHTTVEFLTTKAGFTWAKSADLVGYKLANDNTVVYGRGQTFLEAWPQALTLDKEGCPRDYHGNLVSGKELKRR